MTNNTSTTATPLSRRFNLVLPDALYQQIETVAAETQQTVPHVLKQFIKLGLVAMAIQRDPNKRLIIADTESGTDIEVLF